MADKKKCTFDFILLILCLLPFGFDKLYKGNTKMFVYKLLLHFVAVGIVWWLYDLVCVITGKYKINPIEN